MNASAPGFQYIADASSTVPVPDSPIPDARDVGAMEKEGDSGCSRLRTRPDRHHRRENRQESQEQGRT